MIVAEKYQKIVLNLPNPALVTTVIPTAQEFQYKGTNLTAVHHGLEETKVLRNLGFAVPNPVRHYYRWPGKHKPFETQETTVDFLTLNNRAFCLNDMGTGKSISALWALDYLKAVGLVHKVLVVTPLSTLERTWGDEIFGSFMTTKFAVLHGTRDYRFSQLNDTSHEIYLINHDGIKTPGFIEAMAKRPDIDLIIIDEIAAFRNSSTDRWKAMNAICNKQHPRRIWGMTGTPIPNEPTDAWAQCRLVVPEKVPPYFSKFRDVVMKQVSTYKWMARDGALDIVKDVMQPAIRFTRAECVDLPPVIWETRHVNLTTEQEKAYKDMMTKLYTEYAGGEVLAVNEAVKAGKLVQICCGVMYGADHERITLPAQNRIDVVKEIIEESGSKVIVFVPLTGALEHVAQQLSTDWTVEIIQGGTPKGKRDRVFEDFQTKKDPHVIVAQPGTMSHGLTLTAASTIIWFAPIASNEIFNQAEARISRPGQKLNQLIVMIEGSEIERRMYSRLKTKTKVQGTLLDMLKGEQP